MSIQLGVPLAKDNKVTRTVNPIGWAIGFVAIYSMIWPVIAADITLFLYQTFYFGPNRIPKINRKEYVVFDRTKLTKLNWAQKLNCIYCEYANGIVVYAKAVANQTEAYNCAIKHEFKAKGQDHQNNFYEYAEFL